MNKKYTADIINIGGHKLDAQEMVKIDELIQNGNNTLSMNFPIQAGQTISANDFVMLNDSGEIYKITTTGSVPLAIPIGNGAEYSQTRGPNQDRDNLVRFVDNNENFILFMQGGYNEGSFLQGGKVDNSGNFTFFNPLLLHDADANKIEFDIDETTFGEPVVKGCMSYTKQTSYTGLFAMAFKYTVSSQTFEFGSEMSFGDWGAGGSNSGLITYISSDGNNSKYLLNSTENGYPTPTSIFTITVSSVLDITVGPRYEMPPNNGKGHFVKISEYKVIYLNLVNGSYKQNAIILNINGDAISHTDGGTSLWNNYNYSVATRKIDSENQFYICAPSTSGGANQLVSQQTYDAANDIVVFNENRLELDSNLFVTDMSYDNNTNTCVLSGSSNSIPLAAIVDFNTSTIINKTVGVSAGVHNGSGINSSGDIVFNYNNQSTYPGKGTTTYGQLGDILSSLDPVKTIGVASNNLGAVNINGSVVTDSNLNLTINSKVYVNPEGVISDVDSNGSIYIGFAISSNSFILKISR